MPDRSGGLPVYENLETRERALKAAWERLDPRFQTPNQILGRRYPVGCVALEITQRCNLDCTICYLSESSERVQDIPLPVLFERIDRIAALYGPGVGVQVTGGDPTLRRRDELVAIVRRIAGFGLRPSLFTNGLLATRDLLAELAAAGLFDVAFHVDTTQRRKGYPTEESLNEVRATYIERARGLSIAVIFLTTVHEGNLDAVPMLGRFFLDRSDIVGMASFQIHAETGRGEWREKSPRVTMEAVRDHLSLAAGLPDLEWDGAIVGHPQCHVGVALVTAGGEAANVISDRALYERFLDDFRNVSFDRRDVRGTAIAFLSTVFRRPYWAVKGSAYVAKKLWALRRGLIRSRGKIGKLTFFIQNFMPAHALVQERIDNCSFMVMTGDGPVSMCEHNRRREEIILKPLVLPDRSAFWQPLTGRVGPLSLPVLPTVSDLNAR